MTNFDYTRIIALNIDFGVDPNTGDVKVYEFGPGINQAYKNRYVQLVAQQLKCKGIQHVLVFNQASELRVDSVNIQICHDLPMLLAAATKLSGKSAVIIVVHPENPDARYISEYGLQLLLCQKKINIPVINADQQLTLLFDIKPVTDFLLKTPSKVAGLQDVLTGEIDLRDLLDSDRVYVCKPIASVNGQGARAGRAAELQGFFQQIKNHAVSYQDPINDIALRQWRQLVHKNTDWNIMFQPMVETPARWTYRMTVLVFQTVDGAFEVNYVDARKKRPRVSVSRRIEAWIIAGLAKLLTDAQDGFASANYITNVDLHRDLISQYAVEAIEFTQDDNEILPLFTQLQRLITAMLTQLYHYDTAVTLLATVSKELQFSLVGFELGIFLNRVLALQEPEIILQYMRQKDVLLYIIINVAELVLLYQDDQSRQINIAKLYRWFELFAQLYPDDMLQQVINFAIHHLHKRGYTDFSIMDDIRQRYPVQSTTARLLTTMPAADNNPDKIATIVVQADQAATPTAASETYPNEPTTAVAANTSCRLS